MTVKAATSASLSSAMPSASALEETPVVGVVSNGKQKLQSSAAAESSATPSSISSTSSSSSSSSSTALKTKKPFKTDANGDVVSDRTVCVAIMVNARNRRQVLMVTSRKHETKWIFPKGGLEKGETLLQAAIRESYEEAGTAPDLATPEAEEIFTAYSHSGDGERVIEYHIFEIIVDPDTCLVNAWPEDAERRREWVHVGEAIDRCSAWRNEKNTKLELVEGFKKCRCYLEFLAERRDDATSSQQQAQQS